jgi:putative transposase
MWYNFIVNNRDYKNFGPHSIHHIYNRGNNKERVFFDEQDYRAFLFRLGLALGIDNKLLNTSELSRLPKSRIRITDSPPGLFRLHAFCLMPNHFHLLIEQLDDISISKLIHRVNTSYSKFINKKYDRIGQLFQDQFKSVLIESNPQLMLFCSYIHMNPVKDGFVDKPDKYKWSSYNSYIADISDPLTSIDFLISVFGSRNAFITETTRLYNKNTDLMSKGIFDIDMGVDI